MKKFWRCPYKTLLVILIKNKLILTGSQKGACFIVRGEKIKK